MLCRIPLETNSSHIFAHFDYVAEAEDPGSVGEGLCVYLIDPALDGWDRDFTTAGPLGFVGKKGAVVGIAIDLAGNFCGKPNHVAIKSPAGDTLFRCALPCSAVTPANDWRDVSIQFDIDEHTCDMSIAGEELFTGVKLECISIPRTICIGVCAAANATHHAFIAVNNISLDDDDDYDEEEDNDAELALETIESGTARVSHAIEIEGEAPPYDAGAIVFTEGLKNAKLNNKAATVVRWNAVDCRYELQIEGIEDTRMIKPENVLLAPSSIDSSAHANLGAVDEGEAPPSPIEELSKSQQQVVLNLSMPDQMQHQPLNDQLDSADEGEGLLVLPMRERSYSVELAEEAGVAVEVMKEVLTVEGRNQGSKARVISAARDLSQHRPQPCATAVRDQTEQEGALSLFSSDELQWDLSDLLHQVLDEQFSQLESVLLSSLHCSHLFHHAASTRAD